MSVVDRIEFLGESVASGLITKDDAVQELVEYSDGGYTRRGAHDLITRHTKVRVQYDQVFNQAKEGLHRLDD